MELAATRSSAPSFSPSALPLAFRMLVSANRAKPILEPQLVHCRILRVRVALKSSRVLQQYARDCVDALVDSSNAFSAPDVHEGGPSARRLDARFHLLVSGDLGRLHRRAESHYSTSDLRVPHRQ
jgi:hypothetical protein